MDKTFQKVENMGVNFFWNFKIGRSQVINEA